MDQIPTKKGFFFLQYYYFLHDSVFMYGSPIHASCVCSHFSDGLPYYAVQHSQPTRTLLGQGCMHAQL